MKRTKDLPAYRQEERMNWMIGPFVAVLVVLAIGISIDALAIDDVNVADENTHIGPVPDGVTKLSPDAYLIDRSSDATPNEICKGGGGSTSEQGTEETRLVKKLDAAYVECYGDQNWNYVKAEDNPNLIEGYVKSVSKESVQTVAAVGLGLTLIFPLLVGLVNGFGFAKDSIHARRHRKVKYDSQLARYRAVQASYARDEIDDLQFDEKIQALVNDGFTLPDSGIFKKS